MAWNKKRMLNPSLSTAVLASKSGRQEEMDGWGMQGGVKVVRGQTFLKVIFCWDPDNWRGWCITRCPNGVLMMQS